MFTALCVGGYNLCDKSSFLFHVVDDCILKVGRRKRKAGLEADTRRNKRRRRDIKRRN